MKVNNFILNSCLLAFATIIWGFGYIATKWVLTSFSPQWVNSLRFLIASFFSLPILIYYKSYRRPLRELWAPFVASVYLYLGLLLQTIGLQYTVVAKSGFLTSFYAFFVPFIGIIFLKKKYPVNFWFIVLLAILGILFLFDFSFSSFNLGDWLTLLCAFFCALHIILIDKLVKNFTSSLELNCLQCLFIGLYGTIITYFLDGPISLSALNPFHSASLIPSPLSGLIMLSIFSCVIGFSIQAHVQRTLPPHVVALIFLLESPFAVIFGYFILKESLSPLNLLGCFLVGLASYLVCRLEKKKVLLEPFHT